MSLSCWKGPVIDFIITHFSNAQQDREFDQLTQDLFTASAGDFITSVCVWRYRIVLQNVTGCCSLNNIWKKSGKMRK